MTKYYLYKLKFPNGKIYVGMTISVVRRWRDHANDAASGSKLPVHVAMRKYGCENVEHMVLCIGERGYIASLEVKAIAAFDTLSHGNGYNIESGGGAGPLSEQTKAKISAAHAGKKLPRTPEWQAKLDAARRGQKRSIESRQRMSRGQKGRFRTPEELARMPVMARQKKMTPEYREKLRLASIARWSKPEQREAASKRALARGVAPSIKTLLAAAAAKLNPEFRAAQSRRAHEYYARKRDQIQ